MANILQKSKKVTRSIAVAANIHSNWAAFVAGKIKFSPSLLSILLTSKFDV